MKVKQRPEDFRVEEESRLEPGPSGPFALYRLEKRGLGTPEALRIVRRAWRLAPRATAFAGLKDRHGITGQVVSVRHGPARDFEARGLRLAFLGRSERPASRGTIVRNRFRIVLRDLAPAEASRVVARVGEVADHGFANYYDDQRFGSLRGTGGRFVARALLAGDPETALKLAIASPWRKDRSRVKRRRTLLRARWGQWEALARSLEPSLERRVCERLARDGDFSAAYALLDPTLRALHLAALQSHLFNECLRRAVPPGGPRHEGVAGPYLFHAGDPGPLKERRIPLASRRAPPDDLLDAVLADEGLARAALPFRPGTRAAVVVPGDPGVDAPAPDALNPGRSFLPLRFTLPPGAYATMLVKRCTFDLPRAKSARS